MAEIKVNYESPISLAGKPNVKLRRDDFSAFVYSKAYPTWWDKLMPCPCKEANHNAPRLTCNNCFGRGYFIVERIETRTMFQQMNVSNEYKDWSIERMGTTSITALETDKMSFMDRCILIDTIQVLSQIIYPRTVGDQVYGIFDYPPVEIEKICIYDNDANKLININPNLVEIDEEGRVNLTNIKSYIGIRNSNETVIDERVGISVRYTFNPSYHIIDQLRDAMVSPVDGPNKEVARLEFPLHYVGKRSHMVIDNSNYANLPSGMNDNSQRLINYNNEFINNQKDMTLDGCEICEDC